MPPIVHQFYRLSSSHVKYELTFVHNSEHPIWREISWPKSSDLPHQNPVFLCLSGVMPRGLRGLAIYDRMSNRSLTNSLMCDKMRTVSETAFISLPIGDKIVKRPTIADVAKQAGVSKSTVSRVLNDSTPYLRPETRQRVLEAIAKLDYRPSVLARSLVSKRTHTVSLLISDVGNPFYPEVIHGVENMAFSHGYNVFLCNTNYDLERAMQFVHSSVDRQVDGVLLMSSSMSDEIVIELAEHQIPTVLLDWELGTIEGTVATIQVDFESGIRAAADHLIGLGHRCIAHVSGPLHLQTSRTRRDIFLDQLARQGIDPSQVKVVEGNFRVNGGCAALDQLLSERHPPTAVFTGNDLSALGIIWSARAYGIRIPHGLSVIGLDDIQLAAQVTPALSTVALPRFEIGTTAMRMLLELIADSEHAGGKPDSPLHEVVHTRLVVRKSTAPPSQKT